MGSFILSFPYMKMNQNQAGALGVSDCTFGLGASDLREPRTEMTGDMKQTVSLNVTLYILFEEWVWGLHLSHLNARLVLSNVSELFNKAEGYWGI